MEGYVSQLWMLVLGLVITLITHSFTMFRTARAGVITKLGLNGYRIIYSAISLIGLVLIIYGFSHYRENGYIQIYDPPLGLKHLALLLNFPVFILLAAAYFNGKIKKTLKHPMLAAVKLWAVAHLCANGDLGSILLFGSLLAWAVIARIAAKKREKVEGTPNRDGPVRNDLIAILIGLVAYLAILKGLHLTLIGVHIIG